MNHFELFGFPVQVDLDVKALEAKYRELSLAHHPDRVPPARRLEAVQLTASLNEAVKVLKDPARRAFYLLKLQGVDLERDDGPARRTLPPEFLERILEQRELLEEAKDRRDLGRVRALAAQIQGDAERSLDEGLAALRLGDVDRSAAAMARVRYYARYLEEVEAIEEEAAP